MPERSLAMTKRNRCRAVTSKDQQCAKSALPLSRYCLFHVDVSGATAAGIIATVVAAGLIFALQERSPDLHASCGTTEEAAPHELQCLVLNSGRGEARDVYVSFTTQLPLGTSVWAEPEIGIELQTPVYLPNPNLGPELAALQRAFTVYVPRVSPGDQVSFRVATTDGDNLRASDQVVRIRQTIVEVLQDFGERLAAEHPAAAAKWNEASVVRARVKEENFFTPHKFSYERGRFPVEYLTDEEEEARATQQDYYRQYKQEFLDVFQGRGEFLTPVIRIQATEGPQAVAVFPPYVKTCLGSAEVSEKVVTEDSVTYTLAPKPPATYDGGCPDDPRRLLDGG